MYTTVFETDLWDTVTGDVYARDAEWCNDVGFSAESVMVTDTSVIERMAMWDDNETHLVHEVRWLTHVIEKLEHLIQGLDSLHTELGVVEQAGAYLWKWRSEAPKVDSFNSPPTPPVYWNLKGYYLTEEDAQEALAVEFEQLSELMVAEEGDAFEAALLANLLMNGAGGGA